MRPSGKSNPRVKDFVQVESDSFFLTSPYSLI